MRRIIATLALILACAGCAFAQKYIVVDSEKIFKSLDAYNNAMTTLDTLAKEYQSKVDAKYSEIETLYNNYMAQKSSLSAQTRTQYEQAILTKEQAAAEYQESIFGDEGVMMKKRIELIQPVQRQVFSAIEQYAKSQGYDMVVDKASNATLLYYSESIDHTQKVIEMLKQ